MIYTLLSIGFVHEMNVSELIQEHTEWVLPDKDVEMIGPVGPFKTSR